MERFTAFLLRRTRFLLFAFMLAAVPLAGELKFYPFPVDFRVSLGTPAFFFFLLLLDKIHPMVSGAAAGLAVLLFRVGLETGLSPQAEWAAALRHHGPVFWYYVVYAALFSLLRIRYLHEKPLWIGTLAVVAEIGASFTELSLRSDPSKVLFSAVFWGEIAFLAVVRSFFVLGFYNLILLYQAKWAEAEQRRQYEQMLMLISSLYQDSVHLGKTLVDAERITEACYGLYREMKNHASDDPKAAEWASRMLSIAGEVHDIKKDNQRIAAGLSRLISDGKLGEYMSMRELGGVMAEANRNYAEALGKQVRLSFVSHTDLRVPVYALLSILNNLVANAIEALPGAGSVAVVAEEEKGRLVIRIRDDGPGIPAKYADVIFDPGFTTKFDPSGRPSTGIGLSYARQMAGELGGSLSVEAGPNGKGALFTIVLPVESLTEGGGSDAILRGG